MTHQHTCDRNSINPCSTCKVCLDGHRQALPVSVAGTVRSVTVCTYCDGPQLLSLVKEVKP